MSLLAYLKGVLPTYPSVKAIKRAIDGGQCTINGRIEIFSTHAVTAGDKVVISLDPPKKYFELKVLYEDEALIAYFKPPAVSTETLSPYQTVHRLDKGTSGVILFAKTPQIQGVLEDLFRKRQVEKTYLAICDGSISKEAWTVDDFLAPRARYQGGLLMGQSCRRRGKRAVTHFEVLERAEEATLVMARPITGRTHQIRVHLAGSGHPVLGDWQYGRTPRCHLHPSRQMLHALRLIIAHPVSGQPLRLEAPLPKDFLLVQKSLFSN